MYKSLKTNIQGFSDNRLIRQGCDYFEFFKSIPTCFTKKTQLSDYPQSLDFPPEAENHIRRAFFDFDHTRESIQFLQKIIESDENALGEDPFPVYHSFANGMYRREMHAPKGYFLVGRIHKDEYFVNVFKGHVLVMSEFGAKEVKAPCAFKASAGVKHIGFFLEDTVWVDTSRCEADNVEDAIEEISCSSYEELDAGNKIIEGES